MRTHTITAAALAATCLMATAAGAKDKTEPPPPPTIGVVIIDLQQERPKAYYFDPDAAIDGTDGKAALMAILTTPPEPGKPCPAWVDLTQRLADATPLSDPLRLTARQGDTIDVFVFSKARRPAFASRRVKEGDEQ